MFRQHSEKLISEVKASTGQALRSLLYEKLVNSDYGFLKAMNGSLLSRIIFFELEHILQFLGAAPSLFSGPLILFFAGILVVLRLSSYMRWYFISVMTFSMLAFVIFILNYFNKRSTDGRDKYFSIQSRQAIRLQELIENIDSIKVGLYEDFFKTRLNGLRKKANTNLKTVHTSLGIVEFVLIMTPFIFSCTIVTTYNLFNSEEVKTTQIFTVISMMIAVSVPLRNFSESLRLYRMFLVAYKCTSKFF